MQRELRRLAHSADEQADTGHRQQHPIAARQSQQRQLFALGKHLGIIHRTGIGQQQADTENETEVTDTIHQKGFHVGEDRGRSGKPETDQQVRDQTHGFPAKEQLQEVIAHDEHQHGEGEERDVGEEAVIAFVILHIADGIDMHHQRDEGDDAHHHRRQAVNQEADFHFDRPDCHPGVEHAVEARAIQHQHQGLQRNQKGDQYAEYGDAVRNLTTDQVAEKTRTQQAGDCRAGQRCQWDAQQQMRVKLPRHDEPCRCFVINP